MGLSSFPSTTYWNHCPTPTVYSWFLCHPRGTAPPLMLWWAVSRGRHRLCAESISLLSQMLLKHLVGPGGSASVESDPSDLRPVVWLASSQTSLALMTGARCFPRRQMETYLRTGPSSSASPSDTASGRRLPLMQPPAVCAHAQPSPEPFHPRRCSPPGSSVHDILQARILEPVAVSSSRGSSWPRDWTCASTSPALQADSLPLSLLGSPPPPQHPLTNDETETIPN